MRTKKGKHQGQKPLRVLVVEDNPDGRETLRLLLQMLGYEVAVAADGVQGVEKALEQRPHVAVIDIGLPGLDGYQVARRLRAELGDGIFLITQTGYGQPEDRRRALEAGFDVHLTKPVDPQELFSWLETAAARTGK
jgi:CheY-like chemotaxis protein